MTDYTPKPNTNSRLAYGRLATLAAIHVVVL